MKVLFQTVLPIFLLILSAEAKYTSGELKTFEKWSFLARFCFLSSQGKLHYKFSFPMEFQPQRLLLYYDEADQWPAVYKSKLACDQRVSPPHIKPENNQEISLDVVSPWSGCILVQNNVSSAQYVQCEATRSFRAARERWWYLAISRCQNDTYPGLLVRYSLHMTNGYPDALFEYEYSADEMHILEVDIAFLCGSFVLLVLALIATDYLRKRQLFHTTYKMYLASIFFYFLSLLIMSIAYGKYANDGLDNYGSKTFARAMEAISLLVFITMLLLMGKGFTITRGRISTSGSIKLAVFMTLYAIVYIVLFFYDARISDPGEVLYIYESVPGYGILALRLIAWLYFSYGCFFTVKHYPEKSKFYYPFYIFYSIWFIIGPIFVLVAYFAWPKYQRAKVVNGIDQGITFLAHTFILFLTRPTNTNKNFPYHVRTSQIGILAAESYDYDKELNSFSRYAYAPSDLPTAPDFTGLFSVAKDLYGQVPFATPRNGQTGDESMGGRTSGGGSSRPSIPNGYNSTRASVTATGRSNDSTWKSLNLPRDGRASAVNNNQLNKSIESGNNIRASAVGKDKLSESVKQSRPSTAPTFRVNDEELEEGDLDPPPRRSKGNIEREDSRVKSGSGDMFYTRPRTASRKDFEADDDVRDRTTGRARQSRDHRDEDQLGTSYEYSKNRDNASVDEDFTRKQRKRFDKNVRSNSDNSSQDDNLESDRGDLSNYLSQSQGAPLSERSRRTESRARQSNDTSHTTDDRSPQPVPRRVAKNQSQQHRPIAMSPLPDIQHQSNASEIGSGSTVDPRSSRRDDFVEDDNPFITHRRAISPF